MLTNLFTFLNFIQFPPPLALCQLLRPQIHSLLSLSMPPLKATWKVLLHMEVASRHVRQLIPTCTLTKKASHETIHCTSYRHIVLDSLFHAAFALRPSEGSTAWRKFITAISLLPYASMRIVLHVVTRTT